MSYNGSGSESDVDRAIGSIMEAMRSPERPSGWAARLVVSYPDGYRALPSLVEGIQRELREQMPLVASTQDGIDVLYWLGPLERSEVGTAASEFEAAVLGRLGLQATCVTDHTWEDRRTTEN